MVRGSGEETNPAVFTRLRVARRACHAFKNRALRALSRLD